MLTKRLGKITQIMQKFLIFIAVPQTAEKIESLGVGKNSLNWICKKEYSKKEQGT